MVEPGLMSANRRKYVVVSAENRRVLLARFTTTQPGNGDGLLTIRTTRTRRPVPCALVSRSCW